MPFPTRHTVLAGFSGTYDRTTSAGGSSAALPTFHSPPYPPSRSASPEITSEMILWPASCSRFVTAAASATNAVVVSSSAGMSTSRAARRTPSAAVRSAGYCSAGRGPSFVKKLTVTPPFFAVLDFLRE